MNKTGFLYFFSGTLILYGLLPAFPPVNPDSYSRFPVDAGIPLPEFVENTASLKPDDSGDNRELYGKINSSCFFLFDDDFSPENSYSRISLFPTSFKWRTPSASLPRATAAEAFYYDKKQKKRSASSYTTLLTEQHELPVVSLFAGAEDFFGFEKGIYVQGITAVQQPRYKLKIQWWNEPANYMERGKKWKRKIHWQWMEDKKVKYESDADVGIHGNATRAYPLKSLKLSANKRYGKKSFEYSFFGKNKTTSHHSLLLRNGGNDFDRTLLSDGFIHRACEPLQMHVQGYRPVVVYINGEYWGIHQLREKHDEHFFSNHYGEKKKNLLIMENYTLVYGKTTDAFDEMINFFRTSPVKDSASWNKACDFLDMNNFIDYLCAELFFANSDWPANNVKFFRWEENGEKNNKWRFVLWDMDYALAYTGTSAVQKDMFQHLRETKSVVSELYIALMEYPAFRQQLKQRMTELLQLDFSSEQLLSLYQQCKTEIESETERHILRWHKPSSVEKWNEFNMQTEEFIRKRPVVVQEHVSKYLN
ncbi:MAG: CotH kinase family protein [Bacteroidota bacterium]